MRRLSFVALTLFFVALATINASAEGMSLAQLKSMVADLGYKPSSNAVAVKIDDQGKAKKPIDFFLFNPESDRASILIRMPLVLFPPDRLAKLPAMEMLKANASNRFFYALRTNTDDGTIFASLVGNFNAAAMDKTKLRQAIDELIAAADSGESLWKLEK